MMQKADRRARLVARWLELTREILPSMAAAQRWPVRHDHCFMRICLDAAFGTPWTHAVRAPAIRTMTSDQLALAVAIAERVVTEPRLLPDLNARSLAGRRTARAGVSPRSADAGS